MKQVLFPLFLIPALFFASPLIAKKTPVNYIKLAQDAAEGAIKRHAEQPYMWNYKTALLNNAFLSLSLASEDSTCFLHAKAVADAWISEDGHLREYEAKSYDLRNMCFGAFLYNLYTQNRGGSKYLNAQMMLRKQLYTQPRTQDRVFLFNGTQAEGIQIEALYMAMPFYCMYASMFDEAKVFGDIALQFDQTDKYTQDKNSGLNYQAWSEHGSPSALFAKSIGFYMMALVDLLDYFPLDHPYRGNLIMKLNSLTSALIKCQQPKTGMWLQVPDQPKAEGNHPEPTATAMFAYAIAKGVNNGYLPKKQLNAAKKAFEGLLAHNTTQQDGTLNITGTTTDASSPNENGTRGYYISLPRTNNEPDAVAAFILAAIELDKSEL